MGFPLQCNNFERKEEKGCVTKLINVSWLSVVGGGRCCCVGGGGRLVLFGGWLLGVLLLGWGGGCAFCTV
jgi:hypothetical protein